MFATALFALSLIASSAQPVQTPPPAARAAPPAPPATPPSGPQPQNHEIKAVTGNEGGQPHTGGQAQIPIPAPSVCFRPAAHTPPASTPAPSALTGRPVGQPAAAGLGSHVQREPTLPPADPAAAPGVTRSPG